MRPARHKSQLLRGDLELLPMINVVFLLLMFFLLGARMDSQTGDRIILPELQIKAQAAPDTTPPWVLSLDADGGWRLEALAAPDAILARLASDPDRPIRLRADANASAQALAALLARLPQSAIILELRPLP